ncbi:hypothetical protein [Flavobacterium sp.]|jgi:hypothetical protein|uniref:hypothetical protein n=1 Tax=Flavobacterium sp. TaxID=239 RepID=UPI0037BE341F
MNRKDKIVHHSNLLAKQIGLNPEDKEFNYGRGIGQADNYCLISDWIIIFELEFSQRHPEMNVLKVWPFLDEYSNKKIFLIHHITDTKSVSPNRIELSTFIANKVKNEHNNRFDYFQILNEFDKSKEAELKKVLKQKQII